MSMLWFVNLLFLTRHTSDAARVRHSADAILAITSNNNTKTMNQTSDKKMIPGHGSECWPEAVWNKLGDWWNENVGLKVGPDLRCGNSELECRADPDPEEKGKFRCLYKEGTREPWRSCKDSSECISKVCHRTNQMCWDGPDSLEWGQTCLEPRLRGEWPNEVSFGGTGTDSKKENSCKHDLPCWPNDNTFSQCLQTKGSIDLGKRCYSNSECKIGKCIFEDTSKKLSRTDAENLQGRRVRVTNTDWRIDGTAQTKAFGQSYVFLKSYDFFTGKWTVEKEILKTGLVTQAFGKVAEAIGIATSVSQAASADDNEPQIGKFYTSAFRPDFLEIRNVLSGTCTSEASTSM